MVLEGFGRVWEGLEGVRRGGKGWEEVDGPYNTQKPVRPSVRPSVRRPSVRPSVRRPSAVRPPSVRPPSVRPSVRPPQWMGVCDPKTPQTPSNSAVS